MAEYAVLALLGAVGGRTDEAHAECDDLDDAIRAIRELVAARGRDWDAITLVHIEDYPKLLLAAQHKPSARTPLDGEIEGGSDA